MRKKAVVEEVRGGNALVSVMRSSACEGCHKAAEGCAACSLLGGERRHTSLAQNPIGATVGETVLVETPDSLVLTYAALVFLFPLCLALAFYFVALLGFLWESSYALLCALGGFLLAVLVLLFLSHILSNRKPPSVILARLSAECAEDSEKSEFES